jgi:hypothetical protein
MIGPTQRPLPDNTHHSQETHSRRTLNLQLTCHLDSYASYWSNLEESEVFFAIVGVIVLLVASLRSAEFSVNNYTSVVYKYCHFT